MLTVFIAIIIQGFNCNPLSISSIQSISSIKLGKNKAKEYTLFRMENGRSEGIFMIYEGEIIDAHMHLWDLEKREYPWIYEEDEYINEILGSFEAIRKNFLVSDYKALATPHRIVKSVHVEANTLPKNALEETEWLQEIAARDGFPHAIISYADLRDPDIAAALKELCRFPNVRGVRQVLFHKANSTSVDLMHDSQWREGLRELEKQLLSFDLSIFDHQIPDAALLASEFSDVSFALDHLGWPLNLTDEGFASWKYDLSKLAENDNVYLKLSGIGVIFKADDRSNIERFIRAGIEIFGEERCMFASNFPPDSLFFSLGKLLEIFKAVFSCYDLPTQRKLFYENAKVFYDL